MAVDPQQFAQLQVAKGGDWIGKCQSFVRQALGFNGNILEGQSAKSEYDYSKKIGTIHKDQSPPPNVPVYFKGGSDGHVALSAGGGYVWSTDADAQGNYAAGQISKVKISDLAPHFGGYLGWGENEGQFHLDLSGKTLNNGGNSELQSGKNLVTGPVAGALGDVGSGIVNGLKAVFTSEFMKRLGAALAGGLLILMALYQLSGMKAVPVPIPI